MHFAISTLQNALFFTNKIQIIMEENIIQKAYRLAHASSVANHRALAGC